jgi:hypothetical protein
MNSGIRQGSILSAKWFFSVLQILAFSIKTSNLKGFQKSGNTDSIKTM